MLVGFFAVYANATMQSQEVLRSNNILAKWQGWLEKHSITEASIAISYYDRVLMERGSGMQSDAPVPVASLSKAITGVCVSKLVASNKLLYSRKLNEILPEFDSKVTVAELLSHTSGYTRDITQKPLQYRGRDKEYLEWVSEQELAAGRNQAAIGAFHYNNSNYAMLGAIIRKVTGKTYENACAELVLKPIGISKAKLNKPWRIMSAWGGWKISASDYLKFVNAYFGNDTVDSTSPNALPNYKFDNGISYGLGYFFRKGRNGGFNFWHQGAWDYKWKDEAARFGAYFVSFDNGWSIVVTHNSSTLHGEVSELDRLFGQATHSPQ
jgi:CubicO group peptidase (beta-lactamase class C family)